MTFAAPRSRFITGGIPANNFGVAAQAQLGARLGDGEHGDAQVADLCALGGDDGVALGAGLQQFVDAAAAVGVGVSRDGGGGPALGCGSGRHVRSVPVRRAAARRSARVA